MVTVISKHTTTGLTINEYEVRLASDLRRWLLEMAPPDERSEAAALASAPKRYAHNDIDSRPDGDAEWRRCLENGAQSGSCACKWLRAGWHIEDPEVLAAWRAQEPINAHSHLLAMLLGSSESIPVSNGQLQLGQWQSIMLVDVDGPRDRKLGVSVVGFS